MRFLRSMIENIPIRYFIPSGFVLAGVITLLVYIFIALPRSEEKAFELMEENFNSSMTNMYGRLTSLLGQGNHTAVNLDIFSAASKPGNVALLIVDEDQKVRFADNASFRGKSAAELPFDIDLIALKRAILTGQLITVRDKKNHHLTGYAGLAFVEQGKMRRHVLVMTQSTSALQRKFHDVLVWPISVLGTTLLLLAAMIAAIVWAKVDRRLGWLMRASRQLASEQQNFDLNITGKDEFGQIAEQLAKTHALLGAQRKQLEEAVARAEAANSAKSEFLSNMSHEIRTPMNGVIGSLQLMLTSDSETEKSELAEASLSSAMALLHIINDILDFSKLEAGRIEIKPAPFLLARMMRDIELLMRPVAQDGANSLVVIAKDQDDIWISADEIRLRQVVINLLGNALKFTSKGTVTVLLDIEKLPDRRGVLEISVKDTGTGISERDLQKLFKRFSQLESARKVGGTGLGLAISEQLVKLMGGEIGVESELGKGSRFWFRVPVGLENAQESIEGEVVAPTTSANILVAEDVKLNQILIQKMLTSLGHKFTIASDGFEAIKILEESPAATFDLILMDNQMPGMDGVETAARIQEMGPEIASIPIIALTADAMSDQRKAFEAAGMVGFVSKPIEIDKLRFEIARILGANT